MIITILRWYFKFVLRLYYREITISGLDHIKPGKPQLLIANHQNSLVDGLLFITQIDKDVILTTTSKLRKFPLADKILRRANVQVFYRRVDGYTDNILQRNQDIIQTCSQLLVEGRHVLIFPEGLTTEDGKILPFKSGFARITQAYLEHHDNLEIVPIYLNYTDRKQIRSRISIDILTAIPTTELRSLPDDTFVEECVDLTRSRLLAEEQKHEHEKLEDIPPELNYLDRVLAFPVLLFYFLPSALVIIIGDWINPTEQTRATTRIFLSIIFFPLVFVLQVIFLISLLPILWVYFLLSYIVIYIFEYTRGVIRRTRS